VLKRSAAFVLVFFGASHAASALEQRCGGPLDWLLCINPSLSYSETAPRQRPPNREAQGQTNLDRRAADKPAIASGPDATVLQLPSRPPLSLDYRVVNHVSKTGSSHAPTTKRPEGRDRVMSKDEKQELYRAFLVWQKRQVIFNMRDQSTSR
jgi:hypothetical protein